MVSRRDIDRKLYEALGVVQVLDVSVMLKIEGNVGSVLNDRDDGAS